MCYLKRIVWLVLVGSAVSRGAPEPGKQPPNILIILADDLGYSDLGCYGGEIKTPNLDRMAEHGLRLTQAYNFARCCPSRAALLTGLYPHQTGIGFFANDRKTLDDVKESKRPGYTGVLNEKCVTIAQVLKGAGYQTAASGKWHIGASASPVDRGFDDFYGFIGGYAVDSWDPRMMIRLPEGSPETTYSEGTFFATDAITDHALQFLQKMGGLEKPWLLYLAYQAPHFPVQSRPEDMVGYPEIYQKGWDKIREERFARQKKQGVIPSQCTLSPRSKIPSPKNAKRIGSMTEDGMNPAWDSLPEDRQKDLAQRMALFAGMVSGMDRNIGRVLQYLSETKELDNTLIVFLSDNGACAEWEPFGFDLEPRADVRPGFGIGGNTIPAPNLLHAGSDLERMGQAGGSQPAYGSAWANCSNTPFSLYKHYANEGGISTPFIVHWPRQFPKGGAVINEPVIVMDIMATCLEVSGATYPAEWNGSPILPYEGKSLLSVLKGNPSPHDVLFFEHERNAAVRKGNLKLVRIGREGEWKLYDISNDRSELNDLAKSRPETVQEMAKLWEEWAYRTNVLPY